MRLRSRLVVCTAHKSHLALRAVLRVTGWWAGTTRTPNFAALPSMIDMENQWRQQIAHRTHAGAEPYVGAIVGPWDWRNAGAASQITWYCVRHRGQGLQSTGAVLVL